MQRHHKITRLALRLRTVPAALCAASAIALASTGAAAQLTLDKRLALDPSAGANLGDGVYVDGDLAVVSALGDAAVYVYRIVGGVWEEEAKLTAWDGATGEYFGFSSAISTAGDTSTRVGDLLAVGAVFGSTAAANNSGSMYTWRHDGVDWQPILPVIAASDAERIDFFAARMAMDHNVLVVGAPADELAGNPGGSGTIYVYEFNGSAWVEVCERAGSVAGSAFQFGHVVSVFGAPGQERIVVGAPNEDGSTFNEGAAYVFHKVGSPGNETWEEEARLVSPYPAPGADFGWSAAVSGDVIAIAAHVDDLAAVEAGAVYIFRAPSWAPTETILAPQPTAGDRFGRTLALDGDTLLVGSVNTNDGAGAVYSYRWDGVAWQYVATTPNPDPEPGDQFGTVALEGGTVLIGAWKDDQGGVDAGAVYFGRFENTPLGSTVVQPSDSTTGTTPVTLNFDNVTGEGQTTVTSSATGPPPPSGFQVGNKNLYYEISTSAAFTGSITVCIQWEEGDFGNEENVYLHHHENGSWVQPPNQTRDINANVICAEVTSLSPFALLESVIVDTDGDGLLDSTELDMAQGGGCPDPNNPDSDGDGLWDGTEVLDGTNPCLVDSDGDGIWDADDPLPTEPGATSGWMEDAGRALADDIQACSLALFTGPNPNANSGRRGALANRAMEAANAIAAGDTPTAIERLNSLLARIDGVSPPADWIEDGPDKAVLRASVDLLLNLLAI